MVDSLKKLAAGIATGEVVTFGLTPSYSGDTAVADARLGRLSNIEVGDVFSVTEQNGSVLHFVKVGRAREVLVQAGAVPGASEALSCINVVISALMALQRDETLPGSDAVQRIGLIDVILREAERAKAAIKGRP